MIPALRRTFGLALLLIPVVAFAGTHRALDLDDVLRLHFAGVSEDIIISEIVVTDSVFRLDVDDILRLQEAGVSERLLQFLVDTGRGEDAEDVAGEDPDAASADDTLYADDAWGDETWVNEIEELEPTTVYHVSLNYDYPAWWYDCYWYDYWYWDFNYYPYQCSYVVHLGAWYPGWYGYRSCWAPAYWGYRSWWYDRCGYGSWAGAGYWSSYDPWYYAEYRGSRGFREDRLSRTKTKVGSGSAGLPLIADAGLKLPDVGRLTIRDAAAPSGLRDKTRDGRLVASDRPAKPDGKKPVRRPTDTVKVPDGPDASGGRKPLVPDRGALSPPDPSPVREPVRGVRAPASGGRPVKVKTLTDPSGTAVDPPSRDDSPPPTRPTPVVETPAPKQDPDRGSSPPAKTPTRTVKPAPTPSPKSPPAVTPSHPTPKSPPSVAPSPSRPAPKSPATRAPKSGSGRSSKAPPPAKPKGGRR